MRNYLYVSRSTYITVVLAFLLLCRPGLADTKNLISIIGIYEGEIESINMVPVSTEFYLDDSTRLIGRYRYQDQGAWDYGEIFNIRATSNCSNLLGTRGGSTSQDSTTTGQNSIGVFGAAGKKKKKNKSQGAASDTRGELCITGIWSDNYGQGQVSLVFSPTRDSFSGYYRASAEDEWAIWRGASISRSNSQANTRVTIDTEVNIPSSGKTDESSSGEQTIYEQFEIRDVYGESERDAIRTALAFAVERKVNQLQASRFILDWFSAKALYLEDFKKDYFTPDTFTSCVPATEGQYKCSVKGSLKVLAIRGDIEQAGSSQSLQEQWRGEIAESVASLVRSTSDSQTVFLSDVTDQSTSNLFYPFSRKIRDEIGESILERNHKLSLNPLEAELFLFAGYEKRESGLALSLSLTASATNQEVAKELVTIPFPKLPEGWDQRSMKDVAYEIGMKLQKAVYPQRVNFRRQGIVISDLKGSISEFSSALEGYLAQELERRDAFIRVPEGSDAPGFFNVQGSFERLGEEVALNISFVHPESKEIIGSAHSVIQLKDIPSNLRLTPHNEAIAAEVVESAESKIPEGLQESIRLWVNHSSNLYRADDRLVVSVEARRNLYLRLFYIQSDGLICQIYPAGNNGAGFLRADQVYEVGGKNDVVELVISDETKGEETIKAFASLGPIEDASLPKVFNHEANMSCMTQGYRQLQNDLTRALKLKFKVRPVAELKILITEKDLTETRS
ncbi:MAG: DUF4384 domain-containing protein [Arenicellales bacterium]|nr:DUF4384 domain-containing protein [Arenicellales bacterium]|tara:strand:+ start:61 stop:2262 length:2202 start_codon:yes stop_codon:yes gene_type:complete